MALAAPALAADKALFPNRSTGLSRTVYVFSVGAEHTTARYFARAISALDGSQCLYLDALFDPALLGCRRSAFGRGGAAVRAGEHHEKDGNDPG